MGYLFIPFTIPAVFFSLWLTFWCECFCIKSFDYISYLFIFSQTFNFHFSIIGGSSLACAWGSDRCRHWLFRPRKGFYWPPYEENCCISSNAESTPVSMKTNSFVITYCQFPTAYNDALSLVVTISLSSIDVFLGLFYPS